jgi:hypothetical protein
MWPDPLDPCVVMTTRLKAEGLQESGIIPVELQGMLLPELKGVPR